MLVLKEIQLPVPWGHISAKTWGDPSNYCVIVVHGLMDNAGSFDTLIPLLSESFYYVCIDLPGHGYSSHFPPSFPIHALDFQIAMKLVFEYFQRQTYYVIAHSYGVKITLVTAQLYPEMISKMVCLDSGYTPPTDPRIFAHDLAKSYDSLIKVFSYKGGDTPTFSYEEAINRIITGRMSGRLTYECAEQLGARMIKEVGKDQYIFTYDRKLKTLIPPSFSSQYMQEFLKVRPIKCDGIIIFMNETIGNLPSERLNRYFKLVKFKKYLIKGHHHTHHTNPDSVAPIINNYLLKWNGKL